MLWHLQPSKQPAFPMVSQFSMTKFQEGTLHICLGEHFQIGDESLPVLADTRTTHAMLKPAIVKQPPPQIVEISNEPQEVPVSEFFPFCLSPWRDTYHFPLSSTTSIHLLGQDFSEKYHARISFSQRGKMILDFDSYHQSNQPDELNDALTFLFVLFLTILALPLL